MDRNQKISYEKDFRILFLESKGDAFQGLFEKLMSKRYPGDFMACRPWGNVGDRKNDGYLPSKRTLFQVYAPNELKASEAIQKIREDFSGAKQHWRKYFDRWVFVHNASDGRLPPHVIQELADMQRDNSEIGIGYSGYEELLLEFRQLDGAALESWFGIAPSGHDSQSLGYADLQAVLEHIQRQPTPATESPREVPFGKIEYNMLSEEVGLWLKAGIAKAPIVEAFFSRWHDADYGNQIATAFKARYLELREQKPALHPDLIWGELEAWAAGTVNNDPKHKLAVLTVLAYLFGACEIFEEPPSCVREGAQA